MWAAEMQFIAIPIQPNIFSGGTGWGPLVISWFISPSKYNHKYHTLLLL